LMRRMPPAGKEITRCKRRLRVKQRNGNARAWLP
jgi:hypothetical protein